MSLDPITPGDRIGNVVVGERIGEGGFGVVYEGRDVVLDRRVALKVLRERDLGLNDEDRERFLREARAVARLDSPHVAVVHHVEVVKGRGFVLEMEHVGGGSLARLLGDDDPLAREAPPPLAAARAVEIASQIAAALRVAHRQGVVHGDLKPENVLLTPEGTVKLVDFGLAHILGERRLEATGSVAGSPSYMAPEVIFGEGTDRASDVWSLGVLLYRMLTGRLPFAATTLPALFFAILSDPPPPTGPLVAPALERFVTRCLAKEPALRPDSLSELPSLLERVLDDEAAPGRTSDTGPVARPPAGAVAPPIVVGRERELDALRETIDVAAGGHGRTVLVTGDVGSGKSTLVRWAQARTVARGFRWIELALVPSRGLLRPLLEELRRTLAADEVAGASPLGVDTATLGPAAALLRELLAVERPPELESRQQAVWALEQLLVALATARPLALVVEGAHDAEPGEIAILRDLSRQLREHAVWIGLTARVFEEGAAAGSGALAPFADVEGVVRLRLAPLDPETLYGLVETVLGAPLAAEVAREVVAKADGNPLFALELLRQMEASGAIVRTSREVRASETWGPAATPIRLVDLFAARLRELPDAQRELLEVAAVDGISFDGEALAAVLERPLLSVLRDLQRIARTTGLVVARAGGFHFAHALLRDVLVDGVAPPLRREIHAALAAHLEARTTPVDPERVGVHWEGAGEAAKAVPHLRRALTAALMRHEGLRVMALLPRVRLSPSELDADGARTHAETLLQLARAHAQVTTRRAEAESIYELLTSPAMELAAPSVCRRARIRRAHLRYFTQGLGAVDVPELRRDAEASPIGSDKGRAHYLLGLIAKLRGDLAEAKRELEEALRVHEAGLNSETYRAAALDQLGSVELRSGRPESAMAYYAESSRINRHRTNAAASDVNGVIAALAAGRVEGQADRLARAVRTLELDGTKTLEAHARVIEARLLYAEGKTALAIATLEHVLGKGDVSSYLPASIAARTQLGHLYGVVGDEAGAMEMLAKADAAAIKQGDRGSATLLAAYRCLAVCLGRASIEVGAASTRFMELLRGESQPVIVITAATIAAEATLYGRPAAHAACVGATVADLACVRDFAPAALAGVLVAGYEEYAIPGDGVGRLVAARDALVREPRPERPATLRVIGDLMGAEIEFRSGRLDSAQSLLDRAVSGAVELRHALLQRACAAKSEDIRRARGT